MPVNPYSAMLGHIFPNIDVTMLAVMAVFFAIISFAITMTAGKRIVAALGGNWNETDKQYRARQRKERYRENALLRAEVRREIAAERRFQHEYNRRRAKYNHWKRSQGRAH